MQKKTNAKKSKKAEQANAKKANAKKASAKSRCKNRCKKANVEMQKLKA